MYLGGICFITDRTYCNLSNYEMTEIVLNAGIRFIQYRDKTSTRRRIYEEALKLRELTNRYRATLIINDHADIALAVDADGVHLGQDDLPLEEARRIMGKRIVGISTHDLLQAGEAEAGGADYIGFGPVFPTKTKDAGAPRGVEVLRVIRDHLRIPVIAIGGINMDNIKAVFDAGADAVAMATAICSGNAAENVKGFADLLKAGYIKPREEWDK
jgi:thiamine-phosphate pyrophosphorylase